jgi:DNA-binding NtrC family response regulator
VASSHATVFVTGESGTGKELCAEALHRRSGRDQGRLVSINSSAIPRDLMESEIFGHVRGAFTGATSDHDGAALRADGGTLFFDEICEMSLDLQAKLLRFVQTGVITRVGGSKPHKVDVRIVCATNKDPLEEVRAGRFREDLYYRLHVVPLHLPPLRERGEDILRIADYFLCRMSESENRSYSGFSPDAQVLLLNYFWPGNVRELENVIHNIVVMNHGGMVSARMLPLALARSQQSLGVQPDKAVSALTRFLAPASPARPAPEPTPIRGGPEHLDIRPLWLEEKEIIERAISLCNGNINLAAVYLDISPSTIYRKKLGWKENDAA